MNTFHCEDCGCQFKAVITRPSTECEPHNVLSLDKCRAMILACPHCQGTMIQESPEENEFLINQELDMLDQALEYGLKILPGCVS